MRHRKGTLQEEGHTTTQTPYAYCRAQLQPVSLPFVSPPTFPASTGTTILYTTLHQRPLRPVSKDRGIHISQIYSIQKHDMKLHTNNPQILGTMVQNFVARDFGTLTKELRHLTPDLMPCTCTILRLFHTEVCQTSGCYFISHFE